MAISPALYLCKVDTHCYQQLGEPSPEIRSAGSAAAHYLHLTWPGREPSKVRLLGGRQRRTATSPSFTDGDSGRLSADFITRIASPRRGSMRHAVVPRLPRRSRRDANRVDDDPPVTKMSSR